MISGFNRLVLILALQKTAAKDAEPVSVDSKA